MASNLLECRDPWNRIVSLTAEQWRHHIIAEHPEMDELLDLVGSTLSEPHLVTFDALHRSRENFYRSNVRGRLLLKVCVHFTMPSVAPTATGIIVTAYLTGRVKPKERVKWSLST